ncbi:NADPH-dependent FMN reductase [Zobellia russellii]|uniref:NADPH-dependent FMN reductase n=1 Tax=Zobellia russellii TaxID=248907 RepID=UPI001BFF6405|nr:NAD(P)H-dependent oxidoreductase [Zobellia russellii]MBT9188704.1 NAD(P)H-dependent oxidoreductase [Zobellia russellii]
MATLLAFAGSNSSKSINYQLVKHTVSLIEGYNVQLLNMVNFPFPMFSEDYERENGYSNSLVELKNDIVKADGIIISVNEHNSGPSAYFKNLTDWLSRVERKFLEDKPVLLMSTSGGQRGGMTALETTEKVLPRFGAQIAATFSLPSYQENFTEGEGITNSELAKAHRAAVDQFLSKF